MKNSATTMILKHLQTYGHISGKEAFEKYGTYRLSQIISNLRKRGYIITTEMHDTTTKLGNKSEYGVYVWSSKNEQIQSEKN